MQLMQNCWPTLLACWTSKSSLSLGNHLPKRYLRSAGRRLNELTRQKAAAKNQLHALQATESTPQFVLDSVKQTIANLEQQIKELQQHVLDLVDNNDELNQVLELLLSIAGVGKTSAIYIMGEILILPKDMNVKQWVAHAGLDPREFTSGTSVNKQPRLTKAGNRHLRCALFMPALSATRHNVNVKAFYNHLLDKGKNTRHLCRHAKVVTRYLWYPKNWTTMVLSFMLLLS